MSWLFEASSIFRFSIGFGIWEATDAVREGWLMIAHALIMCLSMTCCLYGGYMQHMMVPHTPCGCDCSCCWLLALRNSSV